MALFLSDRLEAPRGYDRTRAHPSIIVANEINEDLDEDDLDYPE
jgi:hypothetical protein